MSVLRRVAEKYRELWPLICSSYPGTSAWWREKVWFKNLAIDLYLIVRYSDVRAAWRK